jgi:hypothetical protein
MQPSKLNKFNKRRICMINDKLLATVICVTLTGAAYSQPVDPVVIINGIADFGEGVQRIIALFNKPQQSRTQDDLDYIKRQVDQLSSKLDNIAENLQVMEIRITEAGKQNFINFIQASIGADIKSYQADLESYNKMNNNLKNSGYFGSRLSAARKELRKQQDVLRADARTLFNDASKAEYYGEALSPALALLALYTDDAAIASNVPSEVRAKWLDENMASISKSIDPTRDGGVGFKYASLKEEKNLLLRGFDEIDGKYINRNIYAWGCNYLHPNENYGRALTSGIMGENGTPAPLLSNCPTSTPYKIIYYGCFRYIKKNGEKYEVLNSNPEQYEVANSCSATPYSAPYIIPNTQSTVIQRSTFKIELFQIGNVWQWGRVVQEWNEAKNRQKLVEDQFPKITSVYTALNSTFVELKRRRDEINATISTTRGH